MFIVFVHTEFNQTNKILYYMLLSPNLSVLKSMPLFFIDSQYVPQFVCSCIKGTGSLWKGSELESHVESAMLTIFPPSRPVWKISSVINLYHHVFMQII